MGLTIPHHKKNLLRTIYTNLGPGLILWINDHKLWNMHMRFELWNVRSLYTAGSLMTVSRELARYKLMGVQISDGRVVPPNLWESTHFSMEREMRIMN
jgi:hypothetical protein